MAGMLQILTYLLAFYLVMKGVEIMQIGLASNREPRGVLGAIGAISIVACIIVAVVIVRMQDAEAESLSVGMPHIPTMPSLSPTP